MNGGFDTDSLRPPRLKEHCGVSAAINLNIPIFDWGARRSKEPQARLRVQIAENKRTVAVRGLTHHVDAAQAHASTPTARALLEGQAARRPQTHLEQPNDL